MPSRLRLSPLLAVVALTVLAPGAAARDQIVPSFDGTPLATSFFPAAGLKPGQRAPTILMTHGWGGNRTTDDMSRHWLTFYTMSDEEFKAEVAARNALKATRTSAQP